ncbi:hypothetical protein FV218_19385 [Methylobacterium sp. WL69]|uniref:hypothetical protein n=1 Tax=Methylobacterium sp. WL69 TaxID=2603893 RepID=UPI0011CB107E|nr:hypothetical protein [Methylobacterium sp. WL69]TXM67315.1 hypothetical protein FV218_19385 [Methylobacterium sp. WL69]
MQASVTDGLRKLPAHSSTCKNCVRTLLTTLWWSYLWLAIGVMASCEIFSGISLMAPDHDPLWYDRVEADEPLNIYAMALFGIFGVVVFFYDGVAALVSIIKSGAAAAFRDVKP